MKILSVLIATASLVIRVEADPIQIELPCERLAISEEGPFLLPEEESPIPLLNLHYAEGMAFTVCDIPVEVIQPCIGDVQPRRASFKDNPALCLWFLLLNATYSPEVVAVSGQYWGSVGHDTKEGTSASAGVSVASDDKRVTVEVEGKINREPGGKTRSEAKATARGQF